MHRPLGSSSTPERSDTPNVRATPGNGADAEHRLWHATALRDLPAALDVQLDDGLSTAEVSARRARHGSNVLTRRRGPGPLRRMAMQFHQPLVYILLVAGALTAWLKAPVDAAVIMGVVLLNAIIGYVQEARALAAIDALSQALHNEATVLRDGVRGRVDAAELVPGDVVFLEAGDRVPADLRLVRVREFAADESALTGESLPSEKRADDEPLATDASLGDRVNMAYASTLVTRGNATAVVVGIGDATEIGKISHLLATAQPLATPLTRRIEHFSRILLAVILVVAGALFAIGMARGEPILDMLLAAVALAVSAIPEGLPAALTITLAIGVGRMARRRAIVRRLPAVEALGSTTVIGSDKTGTLTQNAMTVQRVVAGGEHFEVSGLGYAPEGDLLHRGAPVRPDEHPVLAECLRAGVLCNDAVVRPDEEGRWRVTGDPTEGALVVSARKGGFDLEALSLDYPRVDAIPFESERQYMATLHAATPGGDGARARLVYVKGAAERVVERCRDRLDASGGRAPLDVAAIEGTTDALAREGLRVLAFARAELPAGTDVISHDDLQGLTFLGLQGMMDPPRAEALRAVQDCHTAGIRVKMITGDHATTALAIAERLGLGGPLGPQHADASHLPPPQVVTGAELAATPDDFVPDLVEKTTVFARVAPEQKLRIVRALQHRGHVVAMTGDGVNDAPALRRADIGVAMGITGTEVSREAADMVLTDDNFASIAAAVEEGRGVFDNIVKFITWTLPTNVGEGLVIISAVATGSALPVLPLHILWINMTTAVLLGLTLAFEPKEPGLMTRPPRRPDAPLMTGALVERMLLVGLILVAGSYGLFQWELGRGSSLEVARTTAVNVFVIGELFYLFNCRSLTASYWSLQLFSNRWMMMGVALMLVAQLAFVYLTPFNLLFRSAPVDAISWLFVVGVGLTINFAVTVEKAIRRRYASS
jgi:cation-transporting P-type ATPase F